VKAVLLDIEGTTTPLAFVVDVLFPYARTHLRSHLERHVREPEYGEMLDRARDEHSVDAGRDASVPGWENEPPEARLSSAVRYFEWLMDRDRKSTALKAIQGRIWEEGYERGELIGCVFDDVPAAFERWRSAGVPIGIFSSGSVLAQQRLFRHSSAGDLSRHITWYFDTTTGPKIQAESYRRIASVMGVESDDVVFVSDIIGELDAARSAGMQTRLALRPGNKPVPSDSGHPAIGTLDDVETLTPQG
jgi:enolase-phosphatase E1